VPQLLLRRFCRGSDERLFQLEVRTGKPVRVTTREAASRRRYYQFQDDEGNKSNAVEAYLALVETYAAPALERLTQDEKISDPDRATLSFFFALLGMRTPGIRKLGEAIGREVFEHFIGSHWGDSDAFSHLYREWQGDDDAAADEAEELRQRTLRMFRSGELEIVDPDGGATMSALLTASADTTQSIFGEMTWTLLRTTGDEFITSDRGLAIFDPTPRFPWSMDAILSSESSQTSIPLGLSRCLVLTPGEPIFQTMDADPVDVMHLNLRTYGWADRHIFGSGQEVVAAVRRAARKHPALVVRPKPFRQVTLLEAEPGDTKLADDHRRRGWPPYLMADGPDGKPRKYDYMVIGEDGTALEVGIETTRLAKARALRDADLKTASSEA